MNSIALELGAIATRTRRMIYGSIVVHALLLAWLLVHQTAAARSEGLTEITWVEVAPIQPEAAPPPVAQRTTESAPAQEVKQQPSRSEPEKKFRRELQRAAVEPTPQKATAAEDVISSRLSSLTRDATAKETRISQMVPPPVAGTPAPAGVDTRPVTRSAPAELERVRESRPAPVELARARPAPTQTAAVVPDFAPPVDSAPSTRPSDLSNKRDLAGAQLAGPVADRGLISAPTPAYPDWAKREGVEASVTLYFLVRPDGRVKENVLVEKTSGFGDFDENAVAALLQWRFEALNGAGEQWGSITFHFRLTDG